METSSESKRSATHVITIPPDETVLTALPYRPQSSLLDFLKGEPKVLGAIQILLALIIVGIGAIFAFNFFHFSQRFPLVFITGYPFWGAFIFIITGLITGLDGKAQSLQSSRRKSLDLHIKAWLSDRRHSTHKQLQLTQTTHRAPDQQDEDELAQGQQSPKRPSQNGHGEDQQDREQPPQTQSEDGQDKAPHQRAEDLKAQEEKLPAQLGQDRRSLDLKTPARQTQDLLKKESLKQKALYKQAPTMQAVPRQHLAWKAQDVPFQGAQYRDIKIREMKSLCEKPSDVRSEDVKSDFHHSSCQSSVQDMYFTYLSNTESDVQQDTSVCSTSYKENPALTSCCLKDQPQSEESD
uniref:Membrane spanning 4-domains A14 n=1 Tax=Rousettus aegyptiacus TaxID=9407 RepID=A0A7J8H2R3_ROUAE|nr:membrane spanning 4-domains A14 [Rousettus aegyptiacus]